jgi:anti-sigma factor RsiW
MNEFDYKTLLEKRWRHPLTAAEEASVRAWLAQHPESRADWDLETQLSEALEKLPDAPVPSNFTARVLQAIEREEAAPKRAARGRPWFLRLLLPRAAVAVVLLGLALLYHEHTAATARRAELVRSVKVVAGVPSLPSPEILQDFDTIRQMPASTGPDQELIALMK